MAATTPICDFGWQAREFELQGADGRAYSLADVRGARGTLVMFICNHCPYVKAVIDKIEDEVSELRAAGMGAIAIMPNDTDHYPEDSLDNMKLFAAQHGLSFPYVIDATQEVARAYDAVCTPDFFGFNAGGALQYRGRLDESRKQSVPGARRDLFDAMTQIMDTGEGPRDQIASMGCSIKWREA